MSFWFWVWVVLAAALYIGEMLTASFFLLPFAIGATVSAIATALGAPEWAQWILFVVVSIIALVLLRPVAKRVTASRPEKSGVDRLVGMTGRVIEGTTTSGGSRARVDREIWNVATDGDERLEEGSAIRVLRVDGTHLIVKSKKED